MIRGDRSIASMVALCDRKIAQSWYEPFQWIDSYLRRMLLGAVLNQLIQVGFILLFLQFPNIVLRVELNNVFGCRSHSH